jgi:hypothetical protein
MAVKVASLAALLAGLAVASGGCGGTTASNGHDAPGPDAGNDARVAPDTGSADAPSAAEGGPGVCSVDPAGGSFVFHIHNGGSRMLTLSFGCGEVAPIVLTTPGGAQAIGPAAVDLCAFTCDEVYAGRAQAGACSDCGIGNGAGLAPGMTFDQPWDRRAYTETEADSRCTTGGATGPCALGTRVAPVASQAGALTVCTDGSNCTVTGGASEKVAFTVDTTKGESTIEVK